MGIINYQIKQHLTTYIAEVLARRESGSLTGSWSQLPNG